MDELKNLKTTWDSFSKVSEKKQYTTYQLKQLLKHKSNNEFQKIKRKMLVEFVFSIILCCFLLVYILIVDPIKIWYSLAFFIAIITISSVPYFIVKKTNVNIDNSLKEYLAEFLKKFKRIYVNTFTVLIPITIVGSFFIGYNISDKDYLSNISFSKITIIVAVIIALSFVGFLLQKKYFNWVYGKNLDRLKECLADLQEN